VVAVSATQDLLRFGVFELNVTTEELRKSGILIRLAPQPLKLLALLARRSGQVVTRDEIQQTLWGEETYVDFEQGMNHCIKQIRNALSDSADAPLYIETIPRRGYRFLAPVVTKTILAPPPRVVESTSGIQTQVPLGGNTPATPLAHAPTAIVLPGPPVLMKSPVATPAPIATQSATPTSTPVATPSPTPTPAPAPAPTFQPTPPIPNIEPSHSRPRWIGPAIIGLLIIAAAVAILYWRARRTASLGEKDNIVVADFDNSTGEGVFDAALKQALKVDLEQSPFVNVLSDQQVSEQLRFMGLPADMRINADTARHICERSGSRAMLVGNISGVGGHYLLGLKAIDCQTGDTLASSEAEASSRSQVLSALGKATRQIRGQLGESLASLQKYDTPVEQATTPSLDALKAYSLGLRAVETQGYDAAVPYLKSAIDLDPNFAMAYAKLGVEYFNLNQPTLAAQYTTKAYQLRDRTSEREKLYIVSHYHDLVTGNADQSIAAYQLLQQAYPREQASYMNLNSWYNTTGHYEEALAQARAALQLDPSNVVNYHNLALTYIYLNRLNDAQAVLQQAESRQLANPALLPDLYEVAFLRGDTAAMGRYVSQSTGKAGIEDQLLALQSDTEAYHGKLERARQLTEAAESSAKNAGASEAAALWQLLGALHEAELGDPQRARRDADAALAKNPGKNVQILGALVLARSGDRKRSEELAAQLTKDYPADTMINDYWVPSIRAAIALAENNPGAVIGALQSTAPYEIGSPPPGIAMYPVYLRGLALLKQGQGKEAGAEFLKMLSNPGISLNASIAALAQLQLARAQALSGDHPAAHKSYDQFLQLWKDADAALPILKQAKTEYAKL
jgi:eukaryotic-like serine/threonine-protein kinase